MKRSDLAELHYIAPISNVASIMRQGILSFETARSFPHDSVAMQAVQERRAKKVVPGGNRLHTYVNLYLCARNPMMYRRMTQHEELCVLRVSTDVLDLPGAVVTDGNASSDHTAFWPSPSGLSKINHDLVFAERWTDGDLFAYWRKKNAKCAELLVPGQVEPRHILGAYVSCLNAEQQLKANGFNLPIAIKPYLFFRT